MGLWPTQGDEKHLDPASTACRGSAVEGPAVPQTFRGNVFRQSGPAVSFSPDPDSKTRCDLDRAVQTDQPDFVRPNSRQSNQRVTSSKSQSFRTARALTATGVHPHLGGVLDQPSAHVYNPGLRHGQTGQLREPLRRDRRDLTFRGFEQRSVVQRQSRHGGFGDSASGRIAQPRLLRVALLGSDCREA